MEQKDKINAVSPSFCLAKWLQVTLHLESGTTHSCHHPDAHKIPLRELKMDVAALHNTLFKKEQRRQMLSGQRPKECGYCWNIEDVSPHLTSDRIIKSTDEWAWPHLEEIARTPVNQNILPTYLELSFAHTCNFKCSYCTMGVSSAWENELKQFGPYSTRTGEARHKALPEEKNPYIKAFWQWWPELRESLHTLRITGGEPLLSTNTFRLLEELIKNPNPRLAMAVNSNLGMSSQIVKKFVSTSRELISKKSVRSLTLYTSLEAWAERGEYIRHGLKFPLFLQNLNSVLQELPEVQIVVMSTFNALCSLSYKDFLSQFHALRKQWTTPQRPLPLILDISYLRDPAFQGVRVLGEQALQPVREAVEYMEQAEFRPFEIKKLKRVHEWIQSPLEEQQARVFRFQFHKFFTEHDLRRKADLLKTFPELENFWRLCEQS